MLVLVLFQFQPHSEFNHRGALPRNLQLPKVNTVSCFRFLAFQFVKVSAFKGSRITRKHWRIERRQWRQKKRTGEQNEKREEEEEFSQLLPQQCNCYPLGLRSHFDIFPTRFECRFTSSPLVSSVVLHLLHSFRVQFYIFSARFECSFTSSPLVSSVVLHLLHSFRVQFFGE